MPYKAHVRRIVHDLFARRADLVLALAVAGASPALPRPADAPAPPARTSACCATPSRSPRPASTRRRSATCTRASSPRTSSRRCYGYDPLARPCKLKPLDRGGDARGLGRLPHLDGPHAARHLLRRRPGVQGPAAASWSRKTTSTRSSASTTRRSRARRQLDPRGRRHRRPRRAARDGAARQEAVRLRHARSRACARSTATRCSSSSREPRPRFLYTLGRARRLGAVAREVVEAYGDTIMAHPVGTGPYRLAEWRRSSRIVLERNPNYRDVRYDAEPDADDAEGQALGARFKGRRLPLQRRRRDRRHRGGAAALARPS